MGIISGGNSGKSQIKLCLELKWGVWLWSNNILRIVKIMGHHIRSVGNIWPAFRWEIISEGINIKWFSLKLLQKYFVRILAFSRKKHHFHDFIAFSSHFFRKLQREFLGAGGTLRHEFGGNIWSGNEVCGLWVVEWWKTVFGLNLGNNVGLGLRIGWELVNGANICWELKLMGYGWRAIFWLEFG